MRNSRILLVLFAAFAVTAQAAKLSGKVKDAANGAAIGNVRVAALHGGREIGSDTTDGNGVYTIDALPAETTIDLTFSKTGYLRDPEIRTTNTDAGTVEECLLVRRTATRAYYELFAEALTRDGANLESLYEALPSESKAMVRAAIQKKK